MYYYSSALSKFLLCTTLLLLRVTASSVTLFPRASNLADPDSAALIFDTSSIPAPTRTPSINAEGTPQGIPKTTPEPNASSASPEGWTPRHTLIVVIVLCVSMIVIAGLWVVFYITRKNEKRRLEEIAARNTKSALAGRVSGSAKNTAGSRPTMVETQKVARPEWKPTPPAGTASGETGNLSSSDLGAVKTMKRSTVGTVRKSGLGRPNVATGTLRATRPPRPESMRSQTIASTTTLRDREGRKTGLNHTRAAALKESEEKQVVFGPGGLPESEEKQVVVVLAPGVPAPVEEEEMVWNGTWNRSGEVAKPGRSLSRSEYMV